ncbi:hypothetical protein [Candidatus Solirubrobacter pratensis]|uniref:hypothetical protein n=1 Tax=Candidatus Solirubrobacter pratensis TaxID=1298857 RepID=UPI0004116A72|nr:hypothetical protein [Candidatus Solirubrobacter pratensis]
MRRIIGIQLHHSVNLDDASRYGVNMLSALEGALKRTGDPEIQALIDQLQPLVRQIGVARTAAGLRLQLHHRDPDFKRYVDGELPWPDELEEGFVPRCTCGDRCLFHDVGRGTQDDCNCDRVCGQHGEAEAA